MTEFIKTVLFTDSDGRAKFREDTLALSEGTAQAALSPLMASGGYQLRQSPVGFRSSFHCTGSPQWLIVLRGQMEIGLQDGSSRVFGPGDHFYSADTLPEGAHLRSGGAWPLEPSGRAGAAGDAIRAGLRAGYRPQVPLGTLRLSAAATRLTAGSSCRSGVP
jgi:hypothetical protein